MAARGLLRLVMLLVVAALAACGGGDEDTGDDGGAETTSATATTETTAGGALALDERVLGDDDLEGFFAGETGEWNRAAEFAPHYRLVDPAQVGRRLARAGFVRAAGNSLTSEEDDATQGLSFAIQLGSARDAARELDWIYGNAAAPCPPGCGVRARPFDVPAIPRVRAVELLAREPTQFGPPFESHRVFFADGPFLYTVLTNGPPGSVPRSDVVSAVEALYERVQGRPAQG